MEGDDWVVRRDLNGDTDKLILVQEIIIELDEQVREDKDFAKAARTFHEKVGEKLGQGEGVEWHCFVGKFGKFSCHPTFNEYFYSIVYKDKYHYVAWSSK